MRQFMWKVIVGAAALGSVSLSAQSKPATCTLLDSAENAVRIACPSGIIEVELLNARTLRVHILPDNQSDSRTEVMDPSFHPARPSGIVTRATGDYIILQSSALLASLSKQEPIRLTVNSPDGRLLFSQQDLLNQASDGLADLIHRPGENLYGMRGLNIWDSSAGLLRNGGAEIDSGAQGDGAAPLFFTTRFGVLFDTVGGVFDTRDELVEFSGGSRRDIEYFAVAGPPTDVLSELYELSGRAPIPPKWTLGFLNSQWGSNQKEILAIADTYRSKHIPVDAFILDYDWKAWGEDHYGEWRWNSISGAGEADPDKFPDGASGDFAQELRAKGVKLAGILKPRIFVTRPGSATIEDDAAAYATEHNLWYGPEPSESWGGRPLRDLDFSKPETRSWFWAHLVPSFNAGMIGWWNDEADRTPAPGGPQFYFYNLQFMNMGRMLYEGQRSVSNLRVWSLNRNFYLGAQRYGYAAWSGDIQTGFASMRYQRMRMLVTVDLNEPHWSMDTGGFVGHPSPENYARWIEFATFVPIDRVHGTLGEKRQPWVYGAVAEAAAANAIRLRYRLLPYIYSYERLAHETGIGVVRPLFWTYPDDTHVANTDEAWMFGDALLVSPVVDQGQSVKSLYLPEGTWYDFFRGTQLAGGRTIQYRVDPHSWADIPVFIRKGSILASQPLQDYVDQHHVSEITLDVFPSQKPCMFVYYDDDGNTYEYEKGVYLRQVITAVAASSNKVHIAIQPPAGTYESDLRTYLINVHGLHARAVRVNGHAIPQVAAGPSASVPIGQWRAGRDRYGSVTTLCVSISPASDIVMDR